MDNKREAAREKAWEELRENWCSGCEVCQFEGDGSCGPKDDGFADRLFNAGFDAGYNARGEAGWVPIRTVEDLPPVVNEKYWVTDRRGFVYSDRYNGDKLLWLRFIAAWMPYQQPPAYTEDK